MSTQAPADLAPMALPFGRPEGASTRVRVDDASLGRHHFHWLRSLLEGLPAGAAWNRYLAFEGRVYSQRLHPTRLGKLLARVARAAERRGLKHSVALNRKRFRDAVFEDLEQSDPSSEALPSVDTTATATTLPTLDEWIEMEVNLQRQSNPDFERDFYSEREWLEAYEDAWSDALSDKDAQPLAEPPALPFAGSQLHADGEADAEPVDLREQLDALNELERALIQSPLPKDPTTAWLRGTMALRLRGAGVQTLAQLVDFINQNGFSWHARVVGIGPQLAGHIVDWLRPWAQAWRTPLLEHALVPVTLLKLQRGHALASIEAPHRFGLVPLDRLAVPAHLDGSAGRFRNRGENAFGAMTDLEAIGGWLSRYRERAKTFTSYGRIAERFYLWCLLERRKALSDIAEADVQAHRDFLSSPPSDWIGKHGVERSSDDWRPMRGPLDPVSQRHTFVVIASMFSALRSAGYLTINPAEGVVARMRLPSPRVNVSRRFTKEQWEILMSSLSAAKDTPFTRRTKMVLELASTTGLRLSELALARVKDIRVEEVDGEPEYILSVLGKGHKLRDVPISAKVKALIEAHHRDMEDACTDIAPNRPIRTKDGEKAPAGYRNEELRPLIGALRKPPSKWKATSEGRIELDRAGRATADRYGQLDSGALYESIKRAFKAALQHAIATGRALTPSDQRAFKDASTHWLRHYFATTYISDLGMDLSASMSMLGHASLNTTSMYVDPELKAVVRAKRAADKKRSA